MKSKISTKNSLQKLLLFGGSNLCFFRRVKTSVQNVPLNDLFVRRASYHFRNVKNGDLEIFLLILVEYV